MKKYENLIKACCVLSFVILIVGFLGIVIFPMPDTDEFINKYLGVVLGTFLFLTIVYTILLIFAPKSVRRNIFKANLTDDPYIADSKYSDFEEIKSKMTSELSKQNYKRYIPENEHNEDSIFIYYMYVGLTTRFYVIACAENEELSSFLNDLSESVYKSLNIKVKWWNFTTFVSSVLCVKKTSDAFFDHLKEAYLPYTGYDFEIRAGYSLDSSTLYIGESPYGGFGISQIKKLRRKLIKMLGISKKDLKK